MPNMNTLTKQELVSRFNQLKADGYCSFHFKSGRYLARPVIEGELIMTIVAGKLETLHVGKGGDIVLQNIMVGSSAERYIIEPKPYSKRYEPTGDTFKLDGYEWAEVEAKGIAEGVKVENGVWNPYPTFAIPAPWAGGEDMLVNVGDWILRPILADLSVPDENDVYRVEQDTFKKTYEAYTPEIQQQRMARLKPIAV